MSSPPNLAAWLRHPKQTPLEIDVAPSPHPGPGELTIRVAHVAINPVDWKTQLWAPEFQAYPSILGRDVAGEVVEVGGGVEGFATGERVIAHVLSRHTSSPRHAAFQHVTTAHAITTSRIPSSLSFSQAAVLPLALSTASAGLYQPNFLALPYASANPPPSTTKPKTLVVWGGSSSVGSTAIQLAAASGLDVATTVSAHNLAYAESVGAKWVFDYARAGVVDEVVETLTGSDFAGAYDAISSDETLRATGEIVQRLGGGKIVTVLGTPTIALPEGVQASGVLATTIAFEHAEVGRAIWGKYVPEALAKGTLLAKPDPLVIKGGLAKVQEGLDTLRKGVSARKVVVEL